VNTRHLHEPQAVSPRSVVGASTVLFTVGILTGSWGPMIPQYAVRTGTTVASVGILIGVASGTGFVVVLVGGALVARFEVRRVIQLATVIIALGLVGLALSSSLPLLATAAALAGGGTALANLSTNQSVSRSGHASAMTHTSVVNTIYSVGAVSFPLLIAVGVSGRTLLLSAAVIALIGGVLVNSLDWVVPRVSAVQQARSASTWTIVALFLIGLGSAVALETSIAGWLPTAVVRSGASETLGAWAATIFYLAMTVGRIITSIIGARARPTVLVVGGMALTLILLVVSAPFKPYIGITIVGFLLAPMFPGTAVWLARLTPGDPSPTTWMQLAAQTGGTFVPPIVGYMLQDTSVAFSLVLAPVALISLLAYSGVLLMVRRGATPHDSAIVGAA
jgi:MFS transporter, FHS family, Na+ dependent glucose transporter 1